MFTVIVGIEINAIVSVDVVVIAVVVAAIATIIAAVAIVVVVVVVVIAIVVALLQHSLLPSPCIYVSGVRGIISNGM